MNNKNSNDETKEKIYTLFKYFITIVMLFMVAVIFINAAMRYIFNSGFAASEELGRFAFIWISFLGMTIAYYNDKHVGVDFIAGLFKGRGRLIFDFITYIAIFISLAGMLYGSLLYFSKTMMLKSPATNIPYGYVYISAIIAMILMLFKLFNIAWRRVSDYKDSKMIKGD